MKNGRYRTCLVAAALAATLGCSRAPGGVDAAAASAEWNVVRLHVDGFKKSKSGAT